MSTHLTILQFSTAWGVTPNGSFRLSAAPYFGSDYLDLKDHSAIKACRPTKQCLDVKRLCITFENWVLPVLQSSLAPKSVKHVELLRNT